MGLLKGKEELSALVIEKCKSQGMELNPALVSSIIDNYILSKIEELEKGNSVKEEGIGTTVPSWRRVSYAFTDVPYTSKIKTDIDKDLKARLNQKLGSSPEYRKAVGAVEL